MKHLSPRQAYDFLLAHREAVFVDCRSEAEYYLVGHPLVERPGEFADQKIRSSGHDSFAAGPSVAAQ